MRVIKIHQAENGLHVLTNVLSSVICPQSVENCVCVLHNLTYQLETESPAVFSKITALELASETRANSADTGPIGCFSNQSRKIQQEVGLLPAISKVHWSVWIKGTTADQLVALFIDKKVWFTILE